MQSSDLIGYAAASLTTTAFFPQAWLTFRSRKAQGVSLGMYIILSSGVALWFVYGLLTDAWPIVLANGVTLLLSLFILGMKLRYG